MAQFLTFTLDNEVFAVDIGKIKEVLEYTVLTKVPRMPESMCGVINLRGNVVPVIDLRLIFEMSKSERTVDTCVIIIEIMSNDHMIVLGVMVDSVREVMSLEQDQICPPPRIGTGLRTEFIRGMGKQGDNFIIILDTDKIFSIDEIEPIISGGEVESFEIS